MKSSYKGLSMVVIGNPEKGLSLVRAGRILIPLMESESFMCQIPHPPEG